MHLQIRSNHNYNYETASVLFENSNFFPPADLLNNEYSTSGSVHVVRTVFHKMAPDSNSELLLRTFVSLHVSLKD